ncbi:phosphohistidine phosphatase [Pontibacter ummariensis]|uniref:Phosphohistidine phosphatase n=1 Tax=Pontibacter ummariensis TaxID=1610492 RepID=A0A239C9X9_9BACT|nr:histidine phosphatase family protein [Pontibacter ummariensis]PRY15389.1 phosphohistidine phosphatase [Pontibacter ummariensis]SNS16478.1 phosphohistidine phosphatase [Pontibacter ummariensis]
MQRTLLICRHAEAADPFPLQPDFERELTPQGLQQAKETGKWLRENFSKIDALLASPAKRTNDTAQIIAGRLYFDQEDISYVPDLYNARESQLLNCLAELPNEAKQVLLVAHNPGVTRLARELTGQMLSYLEPANVVAVALSLEQWEDIHVQTGVLLSHNMEQVQ